MPLPRIETLEAILFHVEFSLRKTKCFRLKNYCKGYKKNESIEKTKEESFGKFYSKIGMKKLKLYNYF